VVVEAGRAQESGVVVRLPGVLIVARAGRPRTADTARRLLDLCAEVAAEPGDSASTGRRLVRRVAGLLAAADPDDVPDFTLLTTVGERIAALVNGEMDVAAATGSGSLTLSGSDSATWVDRLLPDGIIHLHVSPSASMDSGPVPEEAEVTGTGLGFPFDLRVGAVPGIGASLLPPLRTPLPMPKNAASDLVAGYGGSSEPATGAERIPVPVERIPPAVERIPTPTPVSAPPGPVFETPAPPALDRQPVPQTPALVLTKEEQAHRARAGAEPTQSADFDELEDTDGFHQDPPTELAGAAGFDQAGLLTGAELSEDEDS
jgi:hypothetical protein